MSGGGGGSAPPQIPDYLKDIHQDIIDRNGADNVPTSVVKKLGEYFVNNPYRGQINLLNRETPSLLGGFYPSGSYAGPDAPPDSVLRPIVELGNKTEKIIDDRYLYAQAFDEVFSKWQSQSYDDLYDISLETFAQKVDRDFEIRTLPRFRAGMHDIGAVSSSSFRIGEAIMRENLTNELGRFAAEIRLKLEQSKVSILSENIGKAIQQNQENKDFVLKWFQACVEYWRITTVAHGEFRERSLEFNVKQGTWDIEGFQYVANMIAAVSGGVVPGQNRPSKVSSALGGALSGAAAGAAIGSVVPGIGTAIGAAAGFALGGLSGYFA